MFRNSLHGLQRVHLYLNVFCHSEIFFGGWGRPNDYDSYFRGIMGIKKNIFRRFWLGGRGRDNQIREIGQKYLIFKGIYRENYKNGYFFLSLYFQL